MFHYHTDHIGSPREITNSRTEVVWSSTFKTYGALALAHVNEVENPLRFQGQYFDSETGLHYNRNRYYDPNSGQFTTQDPIGLLGGMNAYQYASNPMTWVDPWGLKGEEGTETGSPRVKPRYVFRGDGREPSQVFNDGFEPRGTATDLESYALSNQPSIFVSTSETPTVARDFAGMQGGGYVYTIEDPGTGIDVNKTLGGNSPFPNEREIAMPGGVSSSSIRGARQVDAAGKFTGPFIKNPNYVRR